jgi:hypothetical protein
MRRLHVTTSDVDTDNLEFPTSPAAIDWSFIFRAAAAAAARVYVEGHEVHPQPGAIASRLSRLCHRDEIPEPTLDALIARGDGPRIFFIGRRRYALHADWDEWLTQLAATGGVGISGHRALQQDLARVRLPHKSAETALPPARSTPARSNRLSSGQNYNVTHAATAAHERRQVDPDPDDEVPF